jgi:hypothetical protein
MRNILRLLTRSLAFNLFIVNGSDITTYGFIVHMQQQQKNDLTFYMDIPGKVAVE